MDIKAFENLKVSTMTALAFFDGTINVGPAACLLPIYPLVLPKSELDKRNNNKKTKKKLDIPLCEVPGAIFTLSYEGFRRGLILSENPKFFRNSIKLKIATTTKNVDLGISAGKIHVAGIKNEEMGREAVERLFEHLIAIQKELDYLHSNEEALVGALQWLLAAAKGEEKLFEVKWVDTTDNVVVEVTDKVLDNELIVPKSVPSHVNQRIATFLLRQINEFPFYSSFYHDLEELAKVKYVYQGTLSIKKFIKVMVNFSYNLNCKINRRALRRCFIKLAAWNVEWDYTMRGPMKIESPYEVPEEYRNIKKGKVSKHSFMIQRSGKITQSGPNEQLNKQKYLEFMEILQRNYPLIVGI